MTSRIRRAAGGLTLLEGAWLAYAGFTGKLTGTTCVGFGCPYFPPDYLWVSLPLGAVLLVLGALGVWGASFSYLGSAVVSAIVLLLMGYSAASFAGYLLLSTESDYALESAALAAVTLAVNAVAARARSGLAEQANPMNLPVFG